MAVTAAASALGSLDVVDGDSVVVSTVN